jgi:DnaJ-domain-containing protein 1
MITRMDVFVVVAGLFVGYFLVSWLIAGYSRRVGSASGGQDEPARPFTPPGAGSHARAWHEILGVPPFATLDEIKAAYRRRIAEYHPDKVAGLGDELRALAETKSKEINAAYEAALRAFGAAGR